MTQVEWDQIFNKMDQRFDARVLVLFLEEYDIPKILAQLMERNRVGQYFIVVSDRWEFRYSDLVARYPDLIKGQCQLAIINGVDMAL